MNRSLGVKIILISLLVMNIALSREVISWPRGVDSSTDVFQNYRGLLQIKLSQMPSNFISVFKKDRIVFFEGTEIRTKLCEIRRIVSEDANNKKTITFLYYNKKSSMLYKEIFESIGNPLFDISLKEYVTSKLKFELKKNEEYRSYQLIDLNNTVITKFTLEYYNKNQLFSYFLLGKPLFVWNSKVIDQGTKNERLDILLSYISSDTLIYSPRKEWSINFGKVFGNYTNKIIDYKNKLDLRFISSKGNLISLNIFRRNSSYNIYSSRVGNSQRILKALTKYSMPVTKVEQAAGQNQRLINELQLLINKIDSNDITYVKNQLFILKKAVVEGRINDSR